MSRDPAAPIRPETPHVFLSACSRDLRTFRTVLAANLVRLDFHPVVQEDFTLSYLPLVEKLRGLIGRCDFVIHLAGHAYGAEPREQSGGLRRSYTQHEYHLAKEMGIPVYSFLCADDFSYDTPDPRRYRPETAEALKLQAAHRDFLKGTPKNEEYAPVRSIKEGVDQLVIMQPRLKLMCQHLERYLPAVHSLQQETLDAVHTMHADLAAKLDLLHQAVERQGEQCGYGRLWLAPQRAERFFGRETEFIELLALWDEHRALAITGTGGLGKTALAAELVAWFGPPAGDGWAVRSFPRRLLIHDYYRLQGHDSALAALLVQGGIDPRGLNRAEMESRVATLFAAPDSYLYLEGCEKAEALRDLLRLTGSARVLLTTRNEVAPYGTHGWPLPPLKIPDAAALIAHVSGGNPFAPLPAVTQIAELLAGHGLACRLAGQLLSHKSRTAARLLEDLKKKGLAELSGEEREHESVAWLLRQTSIGLEQSQPGSAQVWHVLALGSLSPLPLSLLREFLGEDEDWLRPRLEALQREGIVHLTSDFPPEDGDEFEPAVVLAHALIQTYGLADLPHEKAPATNSSYLSWREGWDTYLKRCAIFRQLPGGHLRYQALTTQLEGLVARLEERELADFRSLGRLLDHLGSVHSHAGRPLTAAPLYERALSVRKRHLGSDHPDTLATLNNLGILLQEQGDMARAELLFRRAFAGQNRSLGPKHPETLTSLNNLAVLLWTQGKTVEAEPLFRRALEARESSLGPKHPDTLQSINNLAFLLKNRGDVVGAEPLFRRVLEVREQSLGLAHRDTLKSLNNLGELHAARGEWTAAAALFRRAAEEARRILLPEHPDRRRWELNLAETGSKLAAEGEPPSGCRCGGDAG